MILKIGTAYSGRDGWKYIEINSLYVTRTTDKLTPDMYEIIETNVGTSDKVILDVVTKQGQEKCYASAGVIYLINDEGKTIERIN